MSFRSGLRGSYFALVTLAFAEVLRILANAADLHRRRGGRPDQAGRAAGELPVREPKRLLLDCAGSRRRRAGPHPLASSVSRFGAQLVAVRENEAAAKALGVDTLRVKLGAITVSGAVTAAAGCLYAQYFLYVDANIAYGTWISVEAILAPIVGGLGTVFGPLVGAVALHGLGEVTKLAAGSVPGIDLMFFGGLLVAAVAFAPDGILGLLRRLRRTIQPSGAARHA